MKINKEKKVNSESQVSTLYSHPKIKDSLCELHACKQSEHSIQTRQLYAEQNQHTLIKN